MAPLAPLQFLRLCMAKHLRGKLFVVRIENDHSRKTFVVAASECSGDSRTRGA